MEKRFVHKSGRVIHGILDANLVRDAESKPLYFLGTVLDITERKQAEEMLKENEEKFRSALMDLPIMINAVDQNGTIVFWNKKCEEITGYTAAEMVGSRNAME
jgi:hypothetical protein